MADDQSARIMMNCKLWKSAIALYLNVIKRTCNQVLINPIIRTRTCHFRRATIFCHPPNTFNHEVKIR
jgi:hypothetical protein